jgi:PAS domain-containing protein
MGLPDFDADWRFTYRNQAAKRILGPDVPLPEELLGRSLWESFPETRETLIEAELRRDSCIAADSKGGTVVPPGRTL